MNKSDVSDALSCMLFRTIINTNRWLVENENDACDAVRGTTLGLPTEIDYDDLMEQAFAGEVDWVPASYTYSSGPFISSWVMPYIVVTQTYSTNMLYYYIILYYNAVLAGRPGSSEVPCNL